MANTTTKGVTYPTSSDNIAPLESHLQTIAEGADSVGILSGTYSVAGGDVPQNTGDSNNVVINFGATMDSAPKVTCTVEGISSSSNYSVMVVGPTTTTSFTAKIYRLSGSGADTIKIIWHASDLS